MSYLKGPADISGKQKILNLTLVFTTGLVGLSTLIIILASLFLGMWLDQRFLTRPAFTLGLVLASIPVSLIVMIVIVKVLIKRFQRMSDSIRQE
jgi:ABC-type molybdate transport system permease subunit